MTNQGQDIFKTAQELFEKEDYSEATKLFTEAVFLKPESAEHHAWLARSLRASKRFDDALDEANKAIQLEPNNSFALCQRGKIFVSLKNPSSAIQDFNKAIQIAPHNGDLYLQRSFAYSDLNKYDEMLLDSMFAYYYSKGKSFEQTISIDPERLAKYKLWYDVVYQHLKERYLPALSNDELFVWYTIVHLAKFGESEVKSYGSSTNLINNLAYGTGCLCVTSRSLYLLTYNTLTSKFPHPLHARTAIDTTFEVAGAILSITGSFIGIIVGGKSVYEQPQIETRVKKSKFQNDQSWRIPFESIISTEVSKSNKFLLTTLSDQWELLLHFRDDEKILAAAISLGTAKRLAVPSQENIIVSAKQRSSNEVINLLKQLSYLKSQGVISESEYEQKKQDLLARL